MIPLPTGQLLRQGIVWHSSNCGCLQRRELRRSATCIGECNIFEHAFPLLHLEMSPALWGHNKWPAIPNFIMPFFRLDSATHHTTQSSDARNSVFSKNLADRGPDNLLKKQHVCALTCDKVNLYCIPFTLFETDFDLRCIFLKKLNQPQPRSERCCNDSLVILHPVACRSFLLGTKQFSIYC